MANGWFIAPAYGGSDFHFRSLSLDTEEDGFSAKLYPNPANSLINLEIMESLSVNEEITLTIFGAAGRMVETRLLSSEYLLHTINTSSWASGTFTYRITTANAVLQTGSFEVLH